MEDLFTLSLAESTKKAYETGFHLYRHFLDAFGVPNELGCEPVSESLLIQFSTFCHRFRGLQPSTIKLYLCGIRFAFIRRGQANPLCDATGTPHPGLATILRAIKRTATPATRPRLPVTSDLLRQLVVLLKLGTFGPIADLTLETACIVAFFVFLRCGEFTVKSKFDPAVNLSVASIQFCKKSTSASVTLRSSKTDPFRKGVTISLFCTKSAICPVHSLSTYCVFRRHQGAQPSDPLFVVESGTALSRTFFVMHLRGLIARLGLDQTNYNGHSFRIGAATSAAKAKIEDHLIQTLGRWSSNCYVRYIHTSPSTLQEAQVKMGRCD